MQEEKIIEVRRLSAGYAGRTILSDVSFDVRQGEIFIILGGSGSGNIRRCPAKFSSAAKT
jgi:phospholipid/cholesterol/gamma-HCH transport system ATP-binding protein